MNAKDLVYRCRFVCVMHAGVILILALPDGFGGAETLRLTSAPAYWVGVPLLLWFAAPHFQQLFCE